jgi:hypothetical protein
VNPVVLGLPARALRLIIADKRANLLRRLEYEVAVLADLVCEVVHLHDQAFIVTGTAERIEELQNT